MTNSSSRLLTPTLLAQLDNKLEEAGAPITQFWRPGLTQSEMDTLTTEMGITLPVEARIWWAWHDGIDLNAPAWHRGLGGGWDPLPLADAVQDAIRNRGVAAAFLQDHPGVHNCDWPDSWITLCGTVSAPTIACDCAVAAGEPSTVHYYEPADNMEPTRPKAASIGELVHVWLEALDDGTWRIDPDTGDFALLDPSELAAKGIDIADLL